MIWLQLYNRCRSLKHGGPRTVSASKVKCWHIFTDAASEQNIQSGGLGGVLFDSSASVCGWFCIGVSRDAGSLGAEHKQSLMYELELAAAVFALKLWGCDGSDSLFVCYGDNDSVRYSLIRAVASSEVALAVMACHLEWEANASCAT